MELVLDEATKKDIDELIRMRLSYMMDLHGEMREDEAERIEKQLKSYFKRKLGTELIAFVAREGICIVSVAYLHIIEMPANLSVIDGVYGEVLSVYTMPKYRGRGLCSRLMYSLVEYSKEHGLNLIDLAATEDGYPIYKKLGFKIKEPIYTDMRYVIS